MGQIDEEVWIKKEREEEIKAKIFTYGFLLMNLHAVFVLYFFRTRGILEKIILNNELYFYVKNPFIDSVIGSLLICIPMGVVYWWVYGWLVEEELFGIVAESEAYARLRAKYREKFGKEE